MQRGPLRIAVIFLFFWLVVLYSHVINIIIVDVVKQCVRGRLSLCMLTEHNMSRLRVRRPYGESHCTNKF
jgi:hypothetical protein